MQRRFPEGIDGLLEALVWIQRQAATGALGSGGGRPGVLVFSDGLLSRVADAGGSRESGPGDPRRRAGALMKDWSHGDSPHLFKEGIDSAQAPGAPDGLTAGDLILDLVRHHADARWVARRLAGSSGRIGSPATLPAVLPRISMTPIEAFVLSRSDGTLTIEEILQVSPLDPTEVQLALYALLSAGLLTAPGVKLPGGNSQPAGGEARDPAPAPAPAARSTFASQLSSQTAAPLASSTGEAASSARATASSPPTPSPPSSPARASSGAGRATSPRVPASPPAAHAAYRPAATGGDATSSEPAPASDPAPLPPQPAPVTTSSGGGPEGAPARSVLDLDAFLARTGAATKPQERTSATPRGSSVSQGPEASSAASPAPQTSDADRERAEVLGWISTRTGADYYGILGVERSADEGAIRRAYYRVAKRFHPDRFRRPEFEGLVQDVERMFAATTEAYNTLSDDRARAEYERELNARSKGGKGTESDAASQARESYLRAKKHADAEEYFDAASLLEVACGLDPGRPEYWLLLGTVQAKNPRWRKKAEESFQKVLAINPTTMEAFLELARLYRAGGLTRRAQEMYRKVVQWDPQNEEALAVLSGKAGAQEAGVGGKLRSLFKGSRS